MPFQAPLPGTNFLGKADAPNNATISFYTDHVFVEAGDTPAQTFRLTAAHTAIFATAPANPCRHSMTIYPSTGYFTGSLQLHNTLPVTTTRVLTFQGIFMPNQNRARGSFIWREMPNTSTSIIHAGMVEIY
jgi:hypothetical protein